MKKIEESQIIAFKNFLIEQERSEATIKKYVRDIYKFYNYLGTEKLINKKVLLEYKKSLSSKYKQTSINSMLVAVHTFLDFSGLGNYKVKIYRIQKRVFCDKSKELTKQEYNRLLEVAKRKEDERLYLLIQSICATGIRVSEHQFITVEAIKAGRAIVENKGKVREIYFTKELRCKLLSYCKKKRIETGCIFRTNQGKPIDRSNIWKMMKSLCLSANVDEQKVFPHNLRHLFAFTYYSLEKDLVKLAGILGHSCIETTRVYTMCSGLTCEKSLAKLNLVNVV